jgi:hypothetical protein
MKKLLLLLIILFVSISGAFAQYYHNDNAAPKIGFGLSSGAATGITSGYYPEAGGISLNFELPLGKSPVSLLFATGYTFYVSGGGYSADYYNYDGYSDYGGGADYYGDVASFIPVEAGLKIYIHRKLFIEGYAGASFNVNTYASDYTGRTTAFVYSPGIGYTLSEGYSGRSSFDVGLMYENRLEPGGGYSQVALRAVWNFSL